MIGIYLFVIILHAGAKGDIKCAEFFSNQPKLRNHVFNQPLQIVTQGKIEDFYIDHTNNYRPNNNSREFNMHSSSHEPLRQIGKFPDVFSENPISLPAAQHLQKSDFDFVKILGKGAHGTVWKVFDKYSQQFLALKEMQKSELFLSKSAKSVIEELRILKVLKHKFIVKVHYAFQDSSNLYLVQTLFSGGSLHSHLSQKVFTEAETKFVAACIVIGLDYIHSQGVLHKDIKPKNLLFDSEGYLNLADFGLAKVLTDENFKHNSGTRAFMAPEVLCKQNHGVSVDYYALGVVLYEIITGSRPYKGGSRKDYKYQLLNKPKILEKTQIPSGWDENIQDFVSKLLKIEPHQRLGYDGSAEVKSHPWLNNTDWSSLLKKTQKSPFLTTKFLKNPENSTFSESTPTDFQVNPKDWGDLFENYYYIAL